MVGDQHVDAARGRRRDAVVAGDAVVDGDDEARRARRGIGDDLGREAVAVFEAVRHEEIDVGAHRREAAHGDRARGGAVGVVVGDDDDALARGDRVGEPRRGGVDALEQRERRQAREIGVELAGSRDAARGEHAGEHRMDARRGERPRPPPGRRAERCRSRALARARRERARERQGARATG